MSNNEPPPDNPPKQPEDPKIIRFKHPPFRESDYWVGNPLEEWRQIDDIDAELSEDEAERLRELELGQE